MEEAREEKEMTPEIEIFDVEQRSPEWFSLRLGIPTASVFSSVLANGRDGGDSKMRKKLLYTLADEIIYGELPTEGFTNEAMQRGRDMEREAREFYDFSTDHGELRRVGFVRRRFGRASSFIGCSPDALIGDDGILEIKTLAPHLLLELRHKNGFPTEHRAQCQGSLLVTGRKWCDLLVYYRGRTPTIFRLERDKKYIAKLGKALEAFGDDLRQIVKYEKTQRCEPYEARVSEHESEPGDRRVPQAMSEPDSGRVPEYMSEPTRARVPQQMSEPRPLRVSPQESEPYCMRVPKLGERAAARESTVKLER